MKAAFVLRGQGPAEWRLSLPAPGGGGGSVWGATAPGAGSVASLRVALGWALAAPRPPGPGSAPTGRPHPCRLRVPVIPASLSRDPPSPPLLPPQHSLPRSSRPPHCPAPPALQRPLLLGGLPASPHLPPTSPHLPCFPLPSPGVLCSKPVPPDEDSAPTCPLPQHTGPPECPPPTRVWAACFDFRRILPEHLLNELSESASPSTGSASKGPSPGPGSGQRWAASALPGWTVTSVIWVRPQEPRASPGPGHVHHSAAGKPSWLQHLRSASWEGQCD